MASIGEVRYLEGIKGYIPVITQSILPFPNCTSSSTTSPTGTGSQASTNETTVLCHLDDGRIESGISVTYLVEKVTIRSDTVLDGVDAIILVGLEVVEFTTIIILKR